MTPTPTVPDAAVLVAGGGPTGMMLAAELAIAGVDVVVVERRPDRTLDGSRSGGLHARTIEVLDQRGVADRFLDAGRAMQVAGFAGTPLDIGDFPTRHPYGLALWQDRFERILGAWVDELGVRTAHGVEVTGFQQDEDGVTVRLSSGASARAGYLVACDGGRSRIRKAAGIPFEGWGASVSSLVAEVELASQPAPGMRAGGGGVSPLEGGRHRVVVHEQGPADDDAPTLDDLRRAMLAAWGADDGLRSATWISRFTDASRQAARYREGRVLLAGDAAHVHYPVGGQGLNLGLQDAVNLGWKLAQVVRGTSDEALLDTYGAERHPVGARVLRATMAQTPLVTSRSDRLDALRELLGSVLTLDEPRRVLGGRMSGLDIAYDLGPGHPLLGRRMPDLDLGTTVGPTRVFALLHDARPVLLDLGGGQPVSPGPWAERVRLVRAETAGPWELPVLGAVPAPAAVLIRPDGHVAWVGTGTAAGLTEALRRWFGAA